jgi:hypothetical protein
MKSKGLELQKSKKDSSNTGVLKIIDDYVLTVLLSHQGVKFNKN